MQLVESDFMNKTQGAISSAARYVFEVNNLSLMRIMFVSLCTPKNSLSNYSF